MADYRNKSNSKLIKLKWDVGFLNKLIGYVFKRSKNISNSHLRNVQKLLTHCDFSLYETRPVIMERVRFLLNALDAKLDQKFEDESIILDYCTPDNENITIEDILKNLNRYKALNFKEIQYITEFVQDRLVHGVFLNRVEEMKTIIEKVEDGEYRTFEEGNRAVTEWIQGFNAERRNVSNMWTNDLLDFNDPNLVDKVTEIKARLGDISSIIITGISLLNEMLSPGFRPGKLYMFLGLTGGFKSAMLLKIVLDCVQFNAGTYKPKNENAKPYVLYVTMENTIDESFARVWNMAIENTDVEKISTAQILKRLKEEKIVANEQMGVAFIYRPVMSISTADLRDIIDEFESTGREICLLSFDYIKRIRPHERARDEKEMLKNVTNEIRQIAIDYHIAIVSAHQFNRNALAVVNNAKRAGEADLAKFLGGENVGSAYEVMENADMTIALNLEQRKSDLKLFLTFSMLKSRYRVSGDVKYFNQPFYEDNPFRLKNDVLNSKPLGVISLSDDMEGKDVNQLLAGNKGRMNHKFSMTMEKTEEEVFNLSSL